MPRHKPRGIFNNKKMTRLQILQNELSRLNTEVLTDTGFTFRVKQKRISVIVDTIARETTLNPNSGNPTTQGMKGDKGDKGDTGLKGDKGDKGMDGESITLPTPFYQAILYGQPSDRINPVTEEPYLEFQLMNIEDALYQCGWSNVSKDGTPLALTRTTEQINAMPTYPGMLVFNSTLDTLCFRGVLGWRKLTSSAM